MVDFNPNIPQPADNLSVSQGQLLNNNAQLNTIFASDHYTWNDATTASRGFHKQITLPAVLGADPTPGGTSSTVYSKADGASKSQLWFANATQAKQLTNLTITSAANGGTAGGTIYTLDTPWGVRFYSGVTGALSSSTGRTVTFPVAFSTLYVGVASANDNNVNTVSCLNATNQLTLKAQNNGVVASFWAMGVI